LRRLAGDGNRKGSVIQFLIEAEAISKLKLDLSSTDLSDAKFHRADFRAKVKFASFEEYLTWSDDPENYMEGRYELVNGELTQLPPESPENDFIANNLQFLLVALKVAPLRLIRIHSLELQVPVLQLKDTANRYPDLVVLRPEHLDLMGRRLTITIDMPPPQLVAEVVSPGKSNRVLLRRYRKGRDYINKRAQYAARCFADTARVDVPEYWLVDPKNQTVTVLEVQGNDYREVGDLQENRIPVRGIDLSAP
jgi:Uma2 family endonuclease